MVSVPDGRRIGLLYQFLFSAKTLVLLITLELFVAVSLQSHCSLIAVVFFGSLAKQGPKKICSKNVLLVASAAMVVCTVVPPYEVLPEV
jgi:hypothetical protein